MNRLRKREVEALLDAYDSDPVGALTTALRRILDDPTGSYAALVDAAPIDPARRLLLHRHDVDALDDLLAELNESRTLGG